MEGGTMDLCKALLVALAVPDGASEGGVQGANFHFWYKDSAGNQVPVPNASSAVNLGSTLDWLSTNSGGSYDSYVIQLDTPETLSGKRILSYGKTVAIEIRGYSAISISGGTSDGLFEVGSQVTLILGNNLTVNGASVALTNYAGLIVVNGGVLKMLSGSTITGVDLPSDGGAVIVGPMSSVPPVSSFEMQGGSIQGNITSGPNPWEAPGSHGAVLVRAKGQVTLSGGSITNNTRGVVIGGQQASLTVGNGFSIKNNGKELVPKGLRGVGICVGVNQMAAAVELQGGPMGGNGTPSGTGGLPPGGELYVSSNTGVLTLNSPSNMGLSGTVCLTNTNQSQYPALILGPNFTNNPGDQPITLDLASTLPEWIPSWKGKTVLKLGTGSTSSIAALKGRFVLRNFYYSSGNKDYEPVEEPVLSDYHIDDNGVLVLNSNSAT
jgi:hypothetical protein